MHRIYPVKHVLERFRQDIRERQLFVISSFIVFTQNIPDGHTHFIRRKTEKYHIHDTERMMLLQLGQLCKMTFILYFREYGYLEI